MAWYLASYRTKKWQIWFTQHVIFTNIFWQFPNYVRSTEQGLISKAFQLQPIYFGRDSFLGLISMPINGFADISKQLSSRGHSRTEKCLISAPFSFIICSCFNILFLLLYFFVLLCVTSQKSNVNYSNIWIHKLNASIHYIYIFRSLGKGLNELILQQL